MKANAGSTIRLRDGRTLGIGIGCLIAGLLIGWIVLPVRSGREVPVEVIKGITTAVNFDGTAIGLSPDGSDKDAVGYGVAGADFLKDDVWSNETCLTPLKSGQEIEIGVVHPRDEGRVDVVVWVKCLP